MPNPKLETYKNKATGTVYDFTDADAQSKISATVDLLKDTTGWLGGNKNPLTLDNLQAWNTRGTWNNNVYTYSGITYTVNTDSKGNVLSIVSNGTNSSASQQPFCVGIVTLSAGDYTVSGLVTDGGYTSYWINVYNATDGANIKDVKSANEHIDFTLSAEKVIRLNYYVAGSATVSNISVYPMILTPEQYALNPSYRPYHESVELSKYNRSEANVLSAKNLFPIDLNTLKAKNTTGTWSDNVYSLNNATITCTVENGYVTEITANSDNPISQNTNFVLFDGNNSTNLVNSLKGKELTLNGCPKNGSNTSYRMLFSTWGTLENKYDNGDGCTVDVPNNVAGMRFDVVLYSGYTPNNLKFHPMIRLATDPDPTFAPYAMTNRQLTEKVQGIIDAALNANDFAAFKTAIGNL